MEYTSIAVTDFKMYAPSVTKPNLIDLTRNENSNLKQLN